jgi:homopolymeric O-antigen transport system permease protein
MQELVIEAGRTERQYWRDLWRYRELFFFLAWRDLLVRYKQTIVGTTWSVVRPLLTMLILSVVFGRLAKMPSAGVPYPLFVFCAMIPWTFFASAVAECGNSLVGNSTLISKVYFPRVTIPASSVMTSFVDLLISCGLLALLMIWYRFPPGLPVLLLPVFVVIAFAASFGIGLWISALTVRYRDFRFIVPFIVQFGLYISPVGFASDAVPARWRLLYSLNPIVGAIDGFRWSLLNGATRFYWPSFALSVGVVMLVLATGIRYFRNTERTFADVI